MDLHERDGDAFQLLFLSGPHRGSLRCCLGLVLIGREIENSIHIPHPSVSRLHALIGHDGMQHILFDAESLTGTRLNGIRITAPHALLNGDIISVGGKVHLLFLHPSHPRLIVPPLDCRWHQRISHSLPSY
ncbi:MAG: FHA domain-containing protein [Anaerolineales bacterium]|nr:FHA domain-containing protein [Anaerolineales bacterium]